MYLYFEIIWKAYQFIYCFNSSLVAVVVMVTYAFSFSRKIFDLFIQFIYGFNFILVWTFSGVQFVVLSVKSFYKHTLCYHWSKGFGSWQTYGTNENWGKWSGIVAIMVPDIISWKIKLENILSMRVFEWLVVLIAYKIYGLQELEARESKKSFVGLWSL